MKKVILAAAIAIVCCTNLEARKTVVMETTKGKIVMELFDETPLHRNNFVRLVEYGLYDSLLFHRVIKDFMIQGGDPDSKNAEAGARLGEGGLGYRVDAEFCVEKGIWHRRGALAAARSGDSTNPLKQSSSMQFYIVWGKIFDDEKLDKTQAKIDKRATNAFKLTEEMRDCYKTVGGTPHLDNNYTVFGQVIEGLEVVDAIQNVPVDDHNRPLEDVRILRAYVLDK